MTGFFQDPPRLGNQFEGDRVLRSYLRRVLPAQVLADIEPDLRRMGGRAVTDIQAMGEAAEAQPPRHVPFDAWGRRVDRIEVSEAWKQLDRVSAEEGLVAIGYERRHGAFSRLHQFAKLYLFHPASAIYSCPLAMTDGAARALELHGDAALKARALPRLTSRDPQAFWTSGQWMTERMGGSDVSGTATVARLEDGQFRLYGDKWFTSATTSQMAMTLARIEGQQDLSLFYLELRDEDGRLRDIRVNRLKDKLGTKALPTAELTLTGTPATLVGGEGRGVRKISDLFNLTRLYNSVCATGYLRRGVALARDYATRRVAFGKPLAEHPLHLETLADLELDFEAAFHLTFRAAELLGREECGQAAPGESATLRLLTPLAKLWTAKRCVAAMSEVLECFGGAGYVEDTGLPRLLRDAQVLAIWEGTTNVLSLDVLRAIAKEDAFTPFAADLRARLDAVTEPSLLESAASLHAALDGLQSQLDADPETLQVGARGFAFGLARTCAGSLLLEQAQWSLHAEQDGRPAAAARRWCAREAAAPSVEHRRISRRLALDEPC